MTNLDSKACTKCNEVKPLSEFHKRVRSADGLMAQCKTCVNARIKANYDRDPEKKIAQTRQYHLDHPERSKERLAAWYERNRNQVLATHALRSQVDEEYRQRKRSATRRCEQRRRAAKAETQVDLLSEEVYEELLLKWSRQCWICADPLSSDFHWDHVQPLSKGGTHTRDNLRPACPECNTQKNGAWPLSDSRLNTIRTRSRAAHAALIGG